MTQMSMVEVNVAYDFTVTPGGRKASSGSFSGEEFRKKHLIPAYIRANELGTKLHVNLDGVYGYAHSFLDEAFTGMIWDGVCTADELLNVLTFTSNDDESLPSTICSFIREFQ